MFAIIQHNVYMMYTLLLLFADVEVLFQRNNSDGLNSIAVDWVNDELYWIERHDTGYRVC